jgi:hypothetical protein
LITHVYFLCTGACLCCMFMLYFVCILLCNALSQCETLSAHCVESRTMILEAYLYRTQEKDLHQVHKRYQNTYPSSQRGCVWTLR